ncbi:MAG: LysM peptidoglycan-binding domain-containing protein [Gammaproteobacteria bacterium]|nr:LysM peptidoglycan-binding domain-containing protein [Gammaproteobacteria bacterium]
MKSLLDDNRRRGIKADFAHLPLPAETRRFVPRLIALRNVIRNPARYGVTLPRIEDRIRFARVEADAQVHHHHVAALCGVDESLVRQINAGQLRGATPPMGPHRVRLPGACASRIDVARLIARPPSAPPAANGDTATYEVRRGDNLWNIARRHAISLAALTHANPGVGPALAPGKRLQIPSASGAGDDEIVHHVRRGDTLYDLARRYGVTIASITRVNRIRPDSTLHPGQPLKIRTGP